jgi:protein TonB
MRGLRKFILLMSIPFCLVSGSLFAEPLLNGVATHQELGQDVFIGALYSESLSDNADTLFNVNQPMRIELKIVAEEGISARKFTRLWIEGMAINQRQDVLTAQADNVVLFDQLFKNRLIKNDHIALKNIPQKGVVIDVNGVHLGTIQNNDFFKLLLSTWIGRVPLSSGFRDGLLKVGNVDNALRSRFEQIAPSSSRKQAVAQWNAVASSSIASSASSKAQSSVAIIAAAPIPKPLPIEAPRLEIPIIASSSASSAPPVEEDEDEGPALTAQTLLARQFYISDVLQRVNGVIRYPSRALERKQEGSIRLLVVLNRAGDVLSTTYLEESRHTILNREAKDAIYRAAPFPVFPEAIPGSRLELSIPLRFVLPR